MAQKNACGRARPSIDSLFGSDANSINAGGNFCGCMTPNFSISVRRKTKQAHDGEVCVCVLRTKQDFQLAYAI
jgi:hypothetical protein